MLWIYSGLILIFLEIFVVGYWLLGMGISALLTGFFSFYTGNLLYQIIFFAVTSVIFIFTLKKFGKRFFRHISKK